MAEPIDVGFDSCLTGGEPVEVDFTETVEKLCQLVDILIATDPDGDGIINIEGMIELDPAILEKLCEIVDKLCNPLEVVIDPSILEKLCEIVEKLCNPLEVVIDPAILETLEGILDKLCNPLDVVITNDGPIEVEQNCWVVSEPLTGCLDDECVTGIRFWQVFKDGTDPVELGDTLPAGADDQPCPCVIEVLPLVECCDTRIVIDAPGTADIPTLLGLGPGYTVSSFTMVVQTLADPAAPVTIVDCAGNESTAYCGEAISFSGGCGDQTGTLESVTTAAGDRVVIEARICPPLEA